MKRPIKFHPIVLIIAVLVLVVIGPFAYQKWYGEPDTVEIEREIVDFVDQGISPEDQVIFDQQLADILQQIEQSEKRDIHLILVLGNHYAKIGEFGKATEQYLDILSTHPDDAPALENLGYARLKMGDIEGAEKYWMMAIESKATELTYFRVADLITEHFPERIDEIRPLIESGIEEFGQTRGFMVVLGNYYRNVGNLEAAVSHYKIATDLAPEDKALREEYELIKRQYEEEAAKELRRNSR